MKKLVQVSVVLLAAAFALGACGKSEESESKDPPKGETKDKPETKDSAKKEKPGDKTLVLYSGRSEKLVADVIAAFEKSSGIDVQVKYGDSAQLAATVIQEGGKSPADVFWAQDASTIGFLDGKGIFAEMPDDVLSMVIENARGPNKTWIGTSGRARVLAYNTKKLKPEGLPKDAKALTAKAWKGRVGWAPPNASFQSFVAAMMQTAGPEATKEWLSAMKKNGPKDYPKNTPAVMAVSTGEVDVALVNHYYLYRLKKEHGADFPVANHYFKNEASESMVNLSAIGVMKGAKKSASAVAFVKFLVSEEGQKHFVGKNYEFSVIPNGPQPEGAPALDTLKPPALKLAELSDLKSTVKMLRETEVLK